MIEEVTLTIGTYRDNEVDQNHPLLTMLEEIEKSGLSRTDIKLTPLREDHIAQLLSETLHRGVDGTKDLSRLLLKKTGGNPFFLITKPFSTTVLSVRVGNLIELRRQLQLERKNRMDFQPEGIPVSPVEEDQWVNREDALPVHSYLPA